MSYTVIDPIITAWTNKHSLAVYTQYQGEDVRSVDVVIPKGRKYQIWIDLPKKETVSIHAWDYKKQRQRWDGTVDQLANLLEDALQTVKAWMV